MASNAIKNVAQEYRARGIEMPDPSDMASALEKLKDEMAAMGEGYDLPAGTCLFPIQYKA